MFLSDDEFISSNTTKSVWKHTNVKHTMSEDSGTNSESSDSESEVIWVSKPVTLPNNCNNVPNASSVDHNNHLNSSVEQMGSGGTLSFTFSENSRQRSGLENSSTVDLDIKSRIVVHFIIQFQAKILPHCVIMYRKIVNRASLQFIQIYLI